MNGTAAERKSKRSIWMRGACVILMAASTGGLGWAEQGMYFAKRQYEPAPLPVFETTRDKLPSPIFDEDPNYVRCYWKAWELAFKNFHEPADGSGFVSQFIDAAFNQNIFLWDTCFMTMFCNYGHPHVPGIQSLDNFYIKQHEDGEICREIDRTTGKDFEPWMNKEDEPLFSRWGYAWWTEGHGKVPVVYEGRPAPTPNPKLTLDSLNHPIFSWAELESFRLTGDKERLQLVWEPLARYYAALQKYLRQGNGLYITDSASMDNATRNPYLKSGGTGIDISAEMVLFARNLAQVASVLGKESQARQYQRDAEELSALINRLMWDKQRKFYFDLTLKGQRAPVKSIAGFWTLLANVASTSQAAALAAELENPQTFKTVHRVPTLAANEPGYDPGGGYWNGAVWAPTDKMVVTGLESYGYTELAREIALNHLRNVVTVFKETGTVWENYAPHNVGRGEPSKGDFVGWSGIGPISFFIEYAIGVRADALSNTIAWDIRSPARVGVERFWFGGKTVSLICEKADATGARDVVVRSSGPFKLAVSWQGKTTTVQVPAREEVQLRLSGAAEAQRASTRPARSVEAPTYRIYPLRNGVCKIAGHHAFYGGDETETYDYALYIWLILGGDKPILVDAGLTNVAEMNRGAAHVLREPITQEPHESSRAQLRKFGLDPEDIGHILITHMHFDHVDDLPLYTNAKVYVGKKEWEGATGKSPSWGHGPMMHNFLNDPQCRRRLELVEDEKVLPGIESFWIGGHTPGSMAYRIHTAHGWAVLTGDTISLLANFERNTPPGVYSNLEECRAAIEKVRAKADVVLASHDPVALEIWPPTPSNTLKYTIRAIKVGECQVRDYITFQDSDSQDTSTFYLYVWVIEGGPRPIVVDTGPKYPEEFSRGTAQYIPGGVKQLPEERTPAALKRHGIDPAAVSHVIVTHLHPDHYDYFDAFPNARFVVNRREYEEAGAGRIAPDVRAALEERPEALQLVEEEEIVPGVRVFPLGCHTIGSQGVLVRTHMGPAVLTGDVVYKYENIEKDRPTRSPDPAPCREAMATIRSLADIVVPAHDPLTLDRWPAGIIGGRPAASRRD